MMCKFLYLLLPAEDNLLNADTTTYNFTLIRVTFMLTMFYVCPLCISQHHLSIAFVIQIFTVSFIFGCFEMHIPK